MSASMLATTLLAMLSTACGSVATPSPNGAHDAAVEGVEPPPDAAPDALPPDASAGQPPAAPTTVTFSSGTDTGALGGSGNGDLFSDGCPSGQALVGFTGASGAFNASITVVGQVIGNCAPVGVGSVTSGAYPLTTGAVTLLTARGAVTTTAYSLLCPANKFVVGLSLRAGSALDQLNIQCAEVKLAANNNAWVSTVGPMTLVTKAGGDGGGGPIAANCPAGQIATVAHTRVIASSTLVGGIAIGCRTVAGK